MIVFSLLLREFSTHFYIENAIYSDLSGAGKLAWNSSAILLE